MHHNMRKTGIISVILVFAGLALLFLLYRGGTWMVRQTQQEEPRGDHTLRYAGDHLIEYQGHTYREKSNLTTILLMGIDTEGSTNGSPYRSGGQADFLRLIIIDQEHRTVSQLQIDRDTMAPITILGVLGDVSGVRTAQLCLSYGYGDGKEKSCELTRDAVSDLLGGISIDYYISMNLDGISVLNDMLGGVAVTLEDDFSSLDPAMTKGTTLTLKGDQAEFYVRSRKTVGIGTNESRMKRQEEYIAEASGILCKRIREDDQFVETLYDGLSSYLVTNMSKGQLINEVWAAKDYKQKEVLKIDGTYHVGTDGFLQYYIEESDLTRLTLDAFFSKVK